MKKFLSIVLALVIASTSIITTNASSFRNYAVAFDDVATYHANYKAVTVLKEAGIINGKTEAEFYPDDYVTRQEMALFIVKAKTGIVDDTKWAESDANTFIDCTQYLGAINYCYTNSIIKGTSTTEFNPEANIAFKDGIIMAVRALGYENKETADKYSVSGIDYWVPYHETAEDIGLLENLNELSSEKLLTRSETAQLIYNMLKAESYAPSNTPHKCEFFEIPDEKGHHLICKHCFKINYYEAHHFDPEAHYLGIENPMCILCGYSRHIHSYDNWTCEGEDVCKGSCVCGDYITQGHISNTCINLGNGTHDAACINCSHHYAEAHVFDSNNTCSYCGGNGLNENSKTNNCAHNETLLQANTPGCHSIYCTECEKVIGATLCLDTEDCHMCS